MKYLLLLFALTASAGPFTEPAREVPAAVPNGTPLWSFTRETMKVCKAKMSEGKEILLAKQIARIAEERLEGRTHQEAFVLLICIESRFDGNARSKVGAIGLTQVMPKLVPDFAKACGIGEITAVDAADSETNLTLGACVFRSLLDRFNGNVTLSLAGYNSGPDSPTTRKMGALQMGHPETAGYVAAFAMLKEKMERGQK